MWFLKRDKIPSKNDLDLGSTEHNPSEILGGGRPPAEGKGLHNLDENTPAPGVVGIQNVTRDQTSVPLAKSRRNDDRRSKNREANRIHPIFSR